ncbi:MAG: aromatic hydrocarbon degradation protein, partial [Candidatus Marinimicrobia bacterium CG08_land_8_20_14_0_20_45_22]
AYFNPAGLTKLSDGLHFDISNQSIWQKKTVNNNTATLNKDEFVGDVAALVFPTAYVAYKMEN